MLCRLFFIGLLWLCPLVHADRRADPVTPDELQALFASAEMGEAEQSAATNLVEGCIAALRRAERQSHQAYERIQLSQVNDDWTAMQNRIKTEQDKYLAAHDIAAAALLADLQLLVPQGKEEAWNKFTRRRNRRLLLHHEGREGIAVDLVALAAAAKVDEPPEVCQLLAAYELELDRLLLARDSMRAAHRLSNGSEVQDEREAARIHSESRDADCAIMQLQRSTANRLLAMTPPVKRAELQDAILVARSDYMEATPPIRARAARLLAAGRLDEERSLILTKAVAAFDQRHRSANERGLTALEDQQCAMSYQQSNETWDGKSGKAWFDEVRKLQLELLNAVEKVATEDDLDAVDVPPRRR